MDSADKDLYHQKITELLQDEEKIVTCTSLAADLEISINDAKMLLTDFVKDSQLVKHDDVHVTFILSGVLKESKSLAVYLVKETDLIEKKALFNTIYTELIYSVQKSKNIDLNGVTLVDKNSCESSANLRGSVVGKNCIKRNIQKRELPPIKTEEVKESKSFFKKIVSNNVTNSSKTDLEQSSQNHQSSQQLKVKQRSGIANYFTKASINGENKNSKLNGDASENLKLNGDASEKIKDKVCTSTEKEKSEIGKMEVDSVTASSNTPQTKLSSKKRKKTVKADEGANKKRKRIQEICDSDSSDMFDDEKDEDIIEQSDEEPEPPAVVQPTSSLKKRIRKTINETHMDEEGFLVTNIKYIYESASEGEEETALKNTTIDEKPKGLSENKKNGVADLENGIKKQQSKGGKNKRAATGKQTTLMNFFKRN